MAKTKKRNRVKGVASRGRGRGWKWIWITLVVLLLIPAIQVAVVPRKKASPHAVSPV